MDLKSVLTLVGQACGSEEWLATHPDSPVMPWAPVFLSAIHVDLKSGRHT